MSFGENLKEIMQIMNCTSAKLSLKTGISENTINSYLKTGGSIPTVDKAVKIAEALDTTAEFLVKGFEPKKEPNSYGINHNSEYMQIIKNLNTIPPQRRQVLENMISDLSATYKK